MKAGIHILLGKYLNKSKIVLNKTDLYFQMQSHPDYPSLKSISDTLDYFKIDNLVVNVAKDSFEHLPNCFLAQLENNEIVFVEKDKRNIDVVAHYENGEKKIFKNISFIDIWNGNIIVVEKNEEIEASLIKSHKSEFLSITITLVLVLFCFLFFNIKTGLFLITNLIGVFFTYLIVKEELGVSSPVVAKYCSLISTSEKENSCSDVINDKTSKIFNFLSLSDLLVVYFLSITIQVFFFGYNYWLNFCLIVFSVPFILYSLYLQVFKLKTFCLLCLSIIFVLILQSLFLLENETFTFNYISFFQFIILGILILFVWKTYKGELLKNSKLKLNEVELVKFSRNSDVFLKILKSRVVYDNDNNYTANSFVTFGNIVNPVLHIIGFTNPYCGYCSGSFKEYENLLKNFGDKIRFDIVFVVSEDVNHQATQIASKIIELHSNSEELAFEALGNWFNTKNFENWITNYGKPLNTKKTNDILFYHNKLSSELKIQYTPTTLINGYQFPVEYKIEMLNTLVADVILEFE